MPDVFSPEVRSRIMARIRAADTKPEMMLRRGLHAMGWRYRLHDGKLPGRPDMVFPGRKAVILVNGCFWHGHDCHLFRWPGSREQFWRDKITRNIRRDSRNRAALEALGWRVADVWECVLKGRERVPLDAVLEQCSAFLSGNVDWVSIGPSGTVEIGDVA